MFRSIFSNLATAVCTLGIAAAAMGANAAKADGVMMVTRIEGPAKVVDGDTLDIRSNGKVIRIRIEGIDAPESGQTCRDGSGKEWRCGRSATRRLATLIADRHIRCAPSAVDDYSRVIASCTTGKGNVDLGATLVEEGLAWAFRRYSGTYVPQEDVARARGVGIWSGQAIPAWEYRHTRWSKSDAQAPTDCPIKGNISSKSGERIYHMPWSPWYAKTQIDPSSGERWFCSEAEAISAGWRPAGGM
ncbi:thermonuclease family protein [Paracoccus litorisediminis]|uniref:Thermonuclease family protein n=1 Tax=Paracoccus litorisediminis TaxID=2006130 RepID=A0A844HIL4_9RHOB|nr:thermonuclease family protein [Paracoccus litorisediminis]MTH60003.1 thermonuclease family protein [Paracoccus litorisediminis]